MAGRDDWTYSHGGVTAQLTHLGSWDATSVPLLPNRVWRRASRIVDCWGVEGALWALDARAERALDRGQVGLACRWRDLMAAIHVMSEDERAGDLEH